MTHSDLAGVFILVDYPNLLDSILLQSEPLNEFVNSCAKKAIDLYPTNPGITIRFYGSWYYGNEPSDQSISYAKQSRDLNSGFFFRHERTRCRLVIEQALSPIAIRGQRLRRTRRKMRALPKFQFSGKGFSEKHHKCKTPDGECYANALNHWITYNRCPKADCGQSFSELFECYHNKLDDAMLSSDLVWLSFNKSVAGLVVISEDDDVVPAMLSASIQKNCKIVLLKTGRTNRKPSKSYDSLLSASDILISSI